jgi:hypothetical protein
MKHNTMAIVRTRIIFSLLTIITIMFSMGKDLMAQTTASIAVKNIVLVHGGFVDGSGWAGVYKALKKNGYDVTIVQNSTTSLADDVATTERAIAMQNGPVILVGLVRWRCHHRSWQRSEGGGAGVYRRFCARQGRVRILAD